MQISGQAGEFHVKIHLGSAGVVGFTGAEERAEGCAAVCVEELGAELEGEVRGGGGWRCDVKDGVAFCF